MVVSQRMTLYLISRPFSFYCLIISISLNARIQLILSLCVAPSPNYLPYNLTRSSTTSHLIGINSNFFSFIKALSFNSICSLVYIFWYKLIFLLTQFQIFPLMKIKSSLCMSSVRVFVPFKSKGISSSLIII